MDILQVFILSIIEGVTEFLPISSTFHLIFASRLLGLEQTDFVKLFTVFIQSGAILAVVFLYFHEIIHNRKLMLTVLISFIPTGIIGFLMNKVISDVFFESQTIMLTAFVLVGVVFLVVESLIQKGKISITKDTDKLDYKQAVLIGIIQALAVVPGVSRSGAVIVGMMVLGYKRDVSAYYSFLLSIPTIFAASAFDLIKMRHVIDSQTDNLIALGVGFVFSFISAYVVVKWLIGFLKRNTLHVFGIYRFIAAPLLILAGYLGK